jgi:hypothetical protein
LAIGYFLKLEILFKGKSQGGPKASCGLKALKNQSSFLSRVHGGFPEGKTKSVAFTESGLRESQRLLAELSAATDGER